MALIYCVEDDTNIRDLTVYALRNQGYEALACNDGTELWAALTERIPDLILLDIMLPGEDGLTILRKLRERERYRAIRVLLITAKTTEYDVIAGLDCGADDYLRKPFGIMEMLARVRALLRRSDVGEREERVLVCGGLSLDTERRRVQVDGETVQLTAREFDLLHYLLLNRDIVLTREQLLDRVWDLAGDIETRTVDMHIKSLRKKLATAGTLIHTVRGVGYRLGEEA